ncbi:hypothetical protein [Paraburkholderia kururiensis]|uniref:hypothetical protein n=1 Tax=Paraburkholderia kururiensis TaxID=984307 RepID=UPI000365659D|nr:hypothetical protein [Paraburkholderia kururiensis]
MTSEALTYLLNHLVFQQAVPCRIDFKIDTQYDPRAAEQTYTRVTWTGGDVHAADFEVDVPDGPQKLSIMRFTISTRTRIVKTPDGNIPPDNEDPPEADVIMDATIDFMMEYLVQGATPDEFEEAAVTEFFGRQVPFNMWPYYRELVQNLAMRARLPIPNLPPFRIVPKAPPVAK